MKPEIYALMGFMNKQMELMNDMVDRIEDFMKSGKMDRISTVYLAYEVHNYYCALEDILKEIASVFENSVTDPSRYHAELLKRMNIDIPGIRKAFLSDETYRLLDELRRFRHVFRHSYTYELDPERVQHVCKITLNVHKLLEKDVEEFKRFLLDVVEE